MRRIDRSFALVVCGSGAMAALIPGLFVLRMHGHHIHALAHALLPALLS